MLKILKLRGAKYPAEHNVGHMYGADELLSNFYEKCDPKNIFNPGIGGSSKHENYSKARFKHPSQLMSMPSARQNFN